MYLHRIFFFLQNSTVTNSKVDTENFFLITEIVSEIGER